MARLVISFKDKSEEEMKLYNEIIKQACGDNSAYIKRVFRELYGMNEYVYIKTKTKKDEVHTTSQEDSLSNSNIDVSKAHPEPSISNSNQKTSEVNYNNFVDEDDYDDEEIELVMEPELKADKDVEITPTEPTDNSRARDSVYGSFDVATFLGSGFNTNNKN